MTENLNRLVTGGLTAASKMENGNWPLLSDTKTQMTAPGSLPRTVPDISGETIPVSNAGTSHAGRDPQPGAVPDWQTAGPVQYGFWKTAEAFGHSGRRS